MTCQQLVPMPRKNKAPKKQAKILVQEKMIDAECNDYCWLTQTNARTCLCFTLLDANRQERLNRRRARQTKKEVHCGGGFMLFWRKGAGEDVRDRAKKVKQRPSSSWHCGIPQYRRGVLHSLFCQVYGRSLELPPWLQFKSVLTQWQKRAVETPSCQWSWYIDSYINVCVYVYVECDEGIMQYMSCDSAEPKNISLFRVRNKLPCNEWLSWRIIIFLYFLSSFFCLTQLNIVGNIFSHSNAALSLLHACMMHACIRSFISLMS